ncbi:MAG: FAD:protein FMN transferase [Blastocatellia bacterium]
MGTKARLQLYSRSATIAERAMEAAFARLTRLDAVLSDYRESSDLTAFCQQAGRGLVPVDDDLFRLLTLSQVWAGRTSGLFDVTAAPIVQLWRRARRTRQLPDAERLAEAKSRVGIEHLRLDPATRQAGLAKPGMRIDFGGIAKGDAADQALAVLAAHGIDRALVAIGGDIAVSGAPPGTHGWKIGLASPEDPSRPPAHFLYLSHAAVSTSGDLEQSVTIDGRRYSHIVDPRTGLGAIRPGVVSVRARHGATADVLATTLSLLGPEEGLTLLEQLSKIDPFLAARFDFPAGVSAPVLSRKWLQH